MIKALIDIADPNIETFPSRGLYEKMTGKIAPKADFTRPQQAWRDKRENLQAFVTYPWMLDLTDKGGLKFHSTAEETNPVRAKFYREYGVNEVPKIVAGGKFPRGMVASPNFANDKPNEWNDPVWLSEGETYFPVRQLLDTEAFLPQWGNVVAIVDMEAYRKEVTPKFPETAVVSPTNSAAIQDQLSQILAALRTLTQLIQSK